VFKNLKKNYWAWLIWIFLDLFELSDCTCTHGHNYKFFKHQCSLNVGKYYFQNSVVDYWNNLPSNIAKAATVDMFKRLFSAYDLQF